MSTIEDAAMDAVMEEAMRRTPAVPITTLAVSHANQIYRLEQVRGWWMRNRQQMPLKPEQSKLLVELIEGEQSYLFVNMVAHLDLILEKRAEAKS